MIRNLVLIWLFLLSNLYSKGNFFDLSYVDSSYDFYKYSLSYARLISTNVTLGFGYIGYELDSNTYNMLKTSFDVILKDISFGVKPFYFFQKNDSNFYGIKGSINFLSHGSERVTTYGALLSYGVEDVSRKRESFFTSVFFENNFYDEFFIKFGIGIEALNPGKKGVFDKSDFFSLNYSGYFSRYLHSVVDFSVARSFKPDFNSYLYFNFDKINAGVDRVISYIIGLRMYLEESENYYLDASFNLADKKTLPNERIWRIVVGGHF